MQSSWKIAHRAFGYFWLQSVSPSRRRAVGRYTSCPNAHRYLVCTKNLAREFGDKVQLPLSERSFSCESLLEDAQAWFTKAQQQTRLEATSFVNPDDPSTEDLLRELQWLAEDAFGDDWRMVRGMRQPGEEKLHARLPLHELQELWNRRLNDRMPLQYLNHAAHWDDIILAVGPGVLIPRPETQCLLQFAAEAVTSNPELGTGCWVDLGTGSGALAIGLARRLSGIRQVWAVDNSFEAIPWANLNISRLGLESRVKGPGMAFACAPTGSNYSLFQVCKGSWLEPLQDKRGQLCGIVSNPPYIEPHVVPGLQAEVVRHEPHQALDGGGDNGLACLVQICQQAAAFLRPKGFLGLETGGLRQADAASQMLKGEFRDVKIRKDMFGVERFVTALRDTA